MKDNMKYGKLLTISKITKRQGNPYKPETWLCKCDCGNEKIVTETFLNTSPQASCGCYEYKSKKKYDKEFTSEIFKEKINIDETGCWIWKGSKHRQGYGHLRFKKRYELAHRVSWRIHKGEIPKGMNVNHHCDVTCCCNPEHLFLGTQNCNVQDMINKGRKVTNIPKTRRNKLNWNQVQEIKKLHEEGMTRKELQSKYEMSQTCIAKILTGTSWNINWTQEI